MLLKWVFRVFIKPLALVRHPVIETIIYSRVKTWCYAN